MKKFDEDMAKACKKAADELGLVGEFQLNNPHNKFRVVLTDGSVVTVSLPATPRSEYLTLRNVKSTIRNAIISNMRKRGVTGL